MTTGARGNDGAAPRAIMKAALPENRLAFRR